MEGDRKRRRSIEKKDEFESKQMELVEDQSAELKENKLKLSLKEEELDKFKLSLKEKEAELLRKEENLDKRLVMKMTGVNNKRLNEIENKVKELEWKEVELNSKEINLNNYKLELLEKKELLDKTREVVNKNEKYMDKVKKLVKEVTEKLECPVCMETPRKGPVPVCPNGHFVCSKCVTASCPTCRTPMGEGKSLLAMIVLENIDHSCRFEDCVEKFSFGDIENHEKLCPHRTVCCPNSMCLVKVPLHKLVGHLIESATCCFQKDDVKEALNTWNTHHYAISNEQILQLQAIEASWSVNIFSLSGDVFAVYPRVLEGQFYFVVVMFAAESECSKYRFEIVVHERDKDVENSAMIARFEGHPLSIDATEEDLYLYGISVKFMKKIVGISKVKNAFSLSSKLFKK